MGTIKNILKEIQSLDFEKQQCQLTTDEMNIRVQLKDMLIRKVGVEVIK